MQMGRPAATCNLLPPHALLFTSLVSCQFALSAQSAVCQTGHRRWVDKLQKIFSFNSGGLSLPSAVEQDPLSCPNRISASIC